MWQSCTLLIRSTMRVSALKTHILRDQVLTVLSEDTLSLMRYTEAKHRVADQSVSLTDLRHVHTDALN